LLVKSMDFAISVSQATGTRLELCITPSLRGYFQVFKYDFAEGGFCHVDRRN
jgi:hypothetical protein